MGDWLGNVNQVLQLAGSQVGTLAGVRNSIFGVWQVMRDVEATLRDQYRSFDEDEIQRRAAPYDLAACLAPITLPAGSMKEKRAVYFELAVRLRALEEYFFGLYDGSASRTSSSYTVSFGDAEGYFLPWAPRHRVPKDKGTFFKRALARSRILPKKIGEVDVTIYPLSDPRGVVRTRALEPLSFGAGLFKDLELKIRNDDDGFIVGQVVCDNQKDTILDQLVDATNNSCCGAVYPELTIDGDVLKEVCGAIGDGDLEFGLSIVVAGSRHVLGVDGLYRNTATIIDGYGDPAVEQMKFFRFSDGKKPSESIEPGRELAIVLLGDAVLICAICLDFCHLTEKTPYDELDVDYVIVPSCGEAGTMASHLEKANDVQRMYKINTLVVQQYHDGEAAKPTNPLGYVLTPNGLGVSDVSKLATTLPWSIVAI